MTTLKLNRKVETIDIRDEDGAILYEWRVGTDDKSLQVMLNRVGNAFERASDLADMAAAASTPEEVRRANDETARLQKRVITAIIGEQGYNDILSYIGDGEQIDPCEHIIAVGDVFGALCVWLYERCTAKQLRDAGVYFEREQDKARGRHAARVAQVPTR